MAQVRADCVAVYIWRQAAGGIELLQLRRSDGEYVGSWQTVYGGIEAGETAPQAVFRELSEEIGLVPRSLFQLEVVEQFYFISRDTMMLMPVFAAELGPQAIPKLNKEHSAFRWVAAADVPTHFQWRSQRAAIAVLLEELAHPSPARALLSVPVPKH